MEYIIIFFLQILGAALNANRKIMELDRGHPEFTLKEIRDKFIRNEGMTFIGSGLIILLHLLTHLIVDEYYPTFRETEFKLPVLDWSVPYIIASFVTALTLGYFGQSLLYLWLGKAEKYLKKNGE